MTTNLSTDTCASTSDNSGANITARCPTCNAYYYQRTWHENFFATKPATLHYIVYPIKKIECPACCMERTRRYKGKLIIKNLPEYLRPTLSDFIRAYSLRAYHSDCQNRLVSIQEGRQRLIATTTKDTLAVGLAKKIQGVFKQRHPNIVYAKTPPQTSHIEVVF